jgi:hypothetical protein
MPDPAITITIDRKTGKSRCAINGRDIPDDAPRLGDVCAGQVADSIFHVWQLTGKLDALANRFSETSYSDAP